MKPKNTLVGDEFVLEKKGKDYNHDIVKCKNCHQNNFIRNTTRLRRHLSKMCPGLSAAQKKKFEQPATGNQQGTQRQVPASVPSETGNTAPVYTPIQHHLMKVQSTALKRAKKSMAKAFYSSAIPFNFANNSYFKECSTIIGIPGLFPSPKELKGNLLDEVFAEDSQQRALMIAKAQVLSISMDGSNNVKGLPVISINVHIPSPVHYETRQLGSDKKDAEFYRNIISDTITNIGSSKVAAIITDNDATMLAAVDLVINKDHFGVIGQRCFAHVLNLFLRNDLPKSIPPLESLVKSITGICDEIKNTLRKNARFREIWDGLKLDDERSVFVSIPGQTRWLGNQHMIENFHRSKQVLKMMAIEENGLSQQSSQFVLDDVNWQKIEKINTFYNEMAKQINLSQADDTSIAMVTEMIVDSRGALKSFLSNNNWVTENEMNQANKSFDERFGAKFTSEYSTLANILHPRFKGKKLKNLGLDLAEQTLLNYAQLQGISEFNFSQAHLAQEKNSLSQAQMTSELLGCFKQYLQKTGLFASPTFGYDESRDKDVLKWWEPFLDFQGYESLAVVATRLLSIPASGASVERNFSQMNWIHSKKRNRLSDKKVNQLMTIMSAEKVRNRMEKIEVPILSDLCDVDVIDLTDDVVIDEELLIPV